MERSDLQVGAEYVGKIKSSPRSRWGFDARVIVLAVEPHKMVERYVRGRYSSHSVQVAVPASRGAKGVLVARRWGYGGDDEQWVPAVVQLDDLRTPAQAQREEQRQQQAREQQAADRVRARQTKIETARLMNEISGILGSSRTFSQYSDRPLSVRVLTEIVEMLHDHKPAAVEQHSIVVEDAAYAHNARVDQQRAERAQWEAVDAARASVGR